MRLVDVNYNTISESDIDKERGRLYEKTIIKPDAVSVDDVTKSAYEDDDYEMVIVYERISDAELLKKYIDDLKKRLSDTDYVVIKIAEGVSTIDEYAGVIAERQEWRAEINASEKKLKEL